MKTSTEVLVLLVAIASTTVRAQYDSFFFSTTATNFDCPGLPFRCQYPFACSHDATVNKYYCCIPGSTSNVCWTGSTTCSGANDTTAGSNQVDCGGFCCLEDREICTQRDGQINICWATATNPLENVTNARMNRTYSSLASASPTATELSFLLAQVTSTDSPASTTTSATSTSTSGSSTTSTSASGSSSKSHQSSQNALSGGAVAGIVIGAIAGILIIGGAVYFFRRRNNSQSKTTTPSQEPFRQQALPHEYYGGDAKQERQQGQQAQQPKVPHSYGMQQVPQELDAGLAHRVELESTTSGGRSAASELPGSRAI